MIRQEMLDCVQLEVPMKVDCEIGPSWGEAVEVPL
jgi:DNA polymerase I-like protein with 3'-5' exonuclease and polymerase domains